MKVDAHTVAAITGAGSGIGRALAVLLAGRGVTLALADLNSDSLEATRVLCGHAAVSTHVLDVSSKVQVADFAESVRLEHGGVSLLVNNAGVALGGRFEDYSLGDIEWLMNINFWGVVYGCYSFLPLLEGQSQAHIVNVSSIFGLLAPPEQTAYCASKFAVRGFSESLRHELENGPVGLSVVHPGGIRTAIARSARVGSRAKRSPLELEQATLNFEQNLVTSPMDAAQSILEGIEKNAPRILIGRDARDADVVGRLFPGTYWKLLKSRIKT